MSNRVKFPAPALVCSCITRYFPLRVILTRGSPVIAKRKEQQSGKRLQRLSQQPSSIRLCTDPGLSRFVQMNWLQADSLPAKIMCWLFSCTRSCCTKMLIAGPMLLFLPLVTKFGRQMLMEARGLVCITHKQKHSTTSGQSRRQGKPGANQSKVVVLVL